MSMKTDGEEMGVLIERYWKQLLFLVILSGAWSTNSYRIATADDSNKSQDKKIEKLEENVEIINGNLIKNTVVVEGLSDDIEDLAKEISEQSKTTQELLLMILEQKGKQAK